MRLCKRSIDFILKTIKDQVMEISRELAIKILKYLDKNKDFYFPFLVMCKEYSDEDDDFVEVESSEWKNIEIDSKYQTFELWENLQNLYKKTTELMAKGFIDKIARVSLEKDIYELAKKYRGEWKRELCESEDIEEFGLNEYLGGRAEAFEECLYLIRKHNGVPDFKNSYFIKYDK